MWSVKLQNQIFIQQDYTALMHDIFKIWFSPLFYQIIHQQWEKERSSSIYKNKIKQTQSLPLGMYQTLNIGNV